MLVIGRAAISVKFSCIYDNAEYQDSDNYQNGKKWDMDCHYFSEHYIFTKMIIKKQTEHLEQYGM